MILEQLFIFEGFDSGFDQLRSFVLQLAVRGKLVPSKEHESAEVLLSMLASGSKKAYELDDSLKLGVLPSNWVWCSLENLGELNRGKSKHRPRNDPKLYKDGTIPFVQTGDVSRSSGLIETYSALYNEAGLNQSRLWPRGTLCITIAANIGGTGLLAFDACFPDSVVGFLPSSEFESARYFEFVFRVLRERLEDGASSTAQKNINLKVLRSLPIPLPPLPEQKRIVAKVEELTDLSNRLEIAHQTRNKLRDHFTASALDNLTQAQTPDQLKPAWTIIKNNFPTITATPDSIQQLRQTILQLAVQGRLVPQESGRKPGLVRDFLSFQNGFAYKSEWYQPNGVRVLRNANVGHGVVNWSDVKRVSKERAKETERFALQEGDIVLSLDRPLISTGLKVAKISKGDLPSLLLQRVARPVIKGEALTPDYLFLWFNSPAFTSNIDPGRSNGVPHISTRQVEKLEISVPSLTEQQRIVAKVSELMAICDKLERALEAKNEKAAAFVQSVIAHELASDTADSRELVVV